MPIPNFSDILHDDDKVADPLFKVIQPPIDESPENRQNRIQKEQAAKRVSDAIDVDISHCRHERRKKRFKILLLGQSEAGKSTLLKNFQMIHSQKEFRRERESWRPIIFFNVVRSVYILLEAIKTAHSHYMRRVNHSSQTLTGSHGSIDSQNQSSPTNSLPPSTTGSSFPGTHASQITAYHLGLLQRLEAIYSLDASLLKRLSASGQTDTTIRGDVSRELSVRATAPWKDRRRQNNLYWQLQEDPQSQNHGRSHAAEDDLGELEIARQLRAFKGAIQELCRDPILMGLRNVRKLHLNEGSGL